MGQSECKGCTSSDPATDTVKVNVPTGTVLTPDDQVKAAAEAQQTEDLLRADEELEARKQEHDKICEEAERAARERQEQQAQEAAQHQAEAESEAEARRAAEGKEKEEQDAKDKASREAKQNEEAERIKQEAAKQAQIKDAEYKSESFCKNHGFKAPTAPKTSCFSHTFPLHTAVKENNPEAVKALVTVGADTKAKNFSGKTPMEVAKKLNKNDSHQAVISALGGA